MKSVSLAANGGHLLKHTALEWWNTAPSGSPPPAPSTLHDVLGEEVDVLGEP